MVATKVGIIIQARMASSRLPGKVLLPIPPPNGFPLIAHIIQRALAVVDSPRQVVLATSIHAENNPLVDVAQTHGIDVHRGDERDVLSRFINIVAEHDFEHVVRLTGDNPFIDPNILRKTISEHIRSGADYTHTQGLPIGINIEIVRSASLLLSAKKAHDPSHREHVTSYILLDSSFTKHSVDFSSVSHSSLRLTVDYPSDYALACEIAHSLEKPVFTLEDICALLEKRPWLQKINCDNWQVKDYSSWEQERSDAVEILNRLGMTRSATLVAKSSSP